MKKVFIDFYPDNLKRLLDGSKISTLRSPSQASKIKLQKGEKGLFIINNHYFEVFCHGLVHVDEIGGASLVWTNEGFSENNKPKFKQTEEFLAGKIKLFYYTFKMMK